jgi:ADP-ribose pyrophosphatase YjhB (NUDIX family)
MMGPSAADLAQYKPRAPAGVLELNINDQWRGIWIDADELPEDAPVFFAYALVYKGDKAYVTRPRGSDESWRTVEGDLKEGETPEDFVRRASYEMTGAKVEHIELVGFLECKATSQNKDFPAGSITVRPIYIAAAKAVEDVPDDSGFERRRLRLNEHSKAIRDRYPEIDDYMVKAMQRYAVLQASGQV